MSNQRGRGQSHGRGGNPPPSRGGGPGPGGGPRGGGRGGPPGAGRGRGGSGFNQPSGPSIYRENTPAQIPPNLSPQNLQQLITKLQSLKVGPERPIRPGFGTLGRATAVRANFFSVKITKPFIYDYAVIMKPSVDINRVKMRVFDLLEATPQFKPFLPYVAHDRSQRLVSEKQLPQPLVFKVPFYEDNENGPTASSIVYELTCDYIATHSVADLNKYKDGDPSMRDFDIQPITSAINLVTQQYARRNGGIRVGENRFFFPNSAAQPRTLSPGVQAIEGFYTSFRIVQGALALNVNVCMTAFLQPGNVADRLLDFSRFSRGGMPSLPPSMVNALKVRTKHLGHRKKLQSVGTTSARKTTFDCQEYGGKISVENYFKRKYGITLQHPDDLPVVDVGSRTKQNWVPAELCDIEHGNPYLEKLSDTETAEMIKYACNRPRVNAEAIVDRGLPMLGLVPGKGPLNGFGVTVDNEMMVVPLRELPPPRIAYRSGAMNVHGGTWNILNVKFQRGCRVDSWSVLVVRDRRESTFSGPDDPRLGNLVNGFAAKLRSSGVDMPQGRPDLIPINLAPPDRQDPIRARSLQIIRSALENHIKARGRKPSFILVLLENRDNFIYPGLKKIGDVELGVQTVCMQLTKALGDARKQDQYFSNVALKVNTKLGGMNHLLDEQAMKWLVKKKTMMVGIDVTHPGPGSKEGTPSILAVVANVDDSFVQFPASLAIQRSKQEIDDQSSKLVDMMVERLLAYEKKSKALPARIFVYRDGVSEGQYDLVLRTELPQLLQAFKKLETKTRKTYRPTLSIIICGKRHNAKFFSTTSEFADKNGNTRPGSVVDKGVTGVFDYEFYLQAHAGLQGTVKATHYTVVYDENELSADDVQQGTHTASYLYARATKAVSLIPAAYYADLACERGRCYLNDFLVGHLKGGGGKSKQDKEAEAKQVFEAASRAWGQGLHPDTKEVMFYI